MVGFGSFESILMENAFVEWFDVGMRFGCVLGAVLKSEIGFLS